jgi:hypothetical protein
VIEERQDDVIGPASRAGVERIDEREAVVGVEGVRHDVLFPLAVVGAPAREAGSELLHG